MENKERVKLWRQTPQGKACHKAVHKRQHQKRVQWLWEYKKAHPCIKCGQKHPAALTFHHKNPHEKEANISKIAKTWSIFRMQKEIDKCDILCASCHNILHWEEMQNKKKVLRDSLVSKTTLESHEKSGEK